MTRPGRFQGAFLLCGLLVAGLSGTSVAQQPTQAQANAIRQSCRSDYQTFCISVPTGGRASLQCLQEHLTDLSPPCQSAVSAASGGSSHPPAGGPQAGAPQAGSAGAPPAVSMREQAAMLRRSCGGDLRAYCRGVPLGGGRGVACLEENQSRLSPGCQGALAEMHR